MCTRNVPYNNKTHAGQQYRVWTIRFFMFIFHILTHTFYIVPMWQCVHCSLHILFSFGLAQTFDIWQPHTANYFFFSSAQRWITIAQKCGIPQSPEHGGWKSEITRPSYVEWAKYIKFIKKNLSNDRWSYQRFHFFLFCSLPATTAGMAIKKKKTMNHCPSIHGIVIIIVPY